MPKQTSINRVRRDYPICEVHHSVQGYEDALFDESEEYDEELEIEDYQRV